MVLGLMNPTLEDRTRGAGDVPERETPASGTSSCCHGAPSSGTAPGAEQASDPVCGMEVTPGPDAIMDPRGPSRLPVGR
jgi:hypothetical protein